MKVLLLGGSGLLGTALRATTPGTVSLSAPTHAMLNVTDANAMERALESIAPDWIINCVAFTAVDRAESERAAATRLNVEFVAMLGRLAGAHGARVMHFSTDYVFDGLARRAMREDDAPAPLSHYAQTKRDGEVRLLASGAEAVIVRVCWLFGDGGGNFPRMMLERALQQTPSRVVDDQWGTPTLTRDLAAWCWALVARDARGIYHASAAGETTWAEFARRVYAHVGFAEGVTGVPSAEYGAAARRPLYTVMDCTKLDATLGITRRSWESALDEWLGALAAERQA